MEVPLLVSCEPDETVWLTSLEADVELFVTVLAQIVVR